MGSRLDDARQVARALLDDLESTACPIETALMKAKRLARLMRDADAQLWLDYETRGYPSNLDFSELGTCRKYAAAAGRFSEDTGKYYTTSLPEFEAKTKADEALVNSLRPTSGAARSARDFVEKNATDALLQSQLRVQLDYKQSYEQRRGLFVSLKSALHHYATDTYLAIELGDVAESIFDGARRAVDQFVRSYCPKAAEQLVAVSERMAEGSPESFAAALTSCRRLLLTVADAVFAAREGDWTDSSGKPRKVGSEQYKNRLLAFFSESIRSLGSRALIESALEHLASRVDAVYEKTSKGVHADVSAEESRLAVIHTYMLISEVASHMTTKGLAAQYEQ